MQSAPNQAEPGGELDPQSLAAQSIGVLVGSPLSIAGKLPWRSAASGNLMRFDQPFNISGTIDISDADDDTRFQRWCEILRVALEIGDPNEVRIYKTFTGELIVRASSPVGSATSSGRQIHELSALVSGDREKWVQFGKALETDLERDGFTNSITVHDAIMNPPPEEFH